MGVLSGLEPEPVFGIFEELSAIPRCSGNEGAAADYCEALARRLGLRASRDGENNVLIKKPGKGGARVIIQGHLDMVCEKNRSTVHDFGKDPLKLRVGGGSITAGGTTLGADNGIGAAFALALLKGDYALPDISVILTSNEETGMSGAKNIDPAWLEGDYLINADTEEEGVFVAGCAGGGKPALTMGIKSEAPDTGNAGFAISVTGLLGGHSGMDIFRGRGNANIIMARLLSAALDIEGFRLVSINGGMRDNAIPREAFASVSVPPGEAERLFGAVSVFNRDVKRELAGTDGGAEISIKKEAAGTTAFSPACAKKVIGLLLAVPNGALEMSRAVPGMVETSNNVGVVETGSGFVKTVCASRSNTAPALARLLSDISSVSRLYGAEYAITGEYPGWEFNPESRLRKLFAERYEKLTGRAAKTSIIHAGLECGLFSRKNPGLDIVSFGPDITGAHTPDERADIASAARNWRLLLNVLERLAGVE